MRKTQATHKKFMKNTSIPKRGGKLQILKMPSVGKNAIWKVLRALSLAMGLDTCYLDPQLDDIVTIDNDRTITIDVDKIELPEISFSYI